MIVKIVAGVIAVVLVVTYLIPPAIKLKDLALAIVIVIGIALMLIDLWQSIWERD